MSDDDDDDVEWVEDEVVHLGIGCIMQLTDHAPPRGRPPKPKGPRVRMGFHPRERGWIRDGDED